MRSGSITTVSETDPYLKGMFAGTQMTLLAVVLLVLDTSVLFGLGLLLAAAGTAVVAISIYRSGTF